MKFSREQKIAIVKEHLEDGQTLEDLSKKYKIRIEDLKYYTALYKKHGPKVFIEERSTYTREFKLNAIKRVCFGESIRSVSIDLGIKNADILRDWYEKYNKYGESAIKDTFSRSHYLLHEDRLNKIAVDSLKDRNEYLEAENEYLKKLYSLILERNKKSKKKS